MMATSRPRSCEHSRTRRARSMCSSARPCEKLRRTTSTPGGEHPARAPRANCRRGRAWRRSWWCVAKAFQSRWTQCVERDMLRQIGGRRRGGAAQAAATEGRRGVRATPRAARKKAAPAGHGLAGAGAPPAPRRRVSPGAGLQHRHGRQRLALEELEERAARGRDVGDAVGDAELVDRRERVAAAGDRERARTRRSRRRAPWCRRRTRRTRTRRPDRSRRWCRPWR